MTGETNQQHSDDSGPRSDCSSSPHWKPNDRQPPANIDIIEHRTFEPEPPLAEASFTDGIAEIHINRQPQENGHAQD